eukprot:1645439-Amphidinium_carterae.2
MDARGLLFLQQDNCVLRPNSPSSLVCRGTSSPGGSGRNTSSLHSHGTFPMAGVDHALSFQWLLFRPQVTVECCV